MVTEEQVRAALDQIAARLGGLDPEQWRRHAVDRTVSCRVPDLDLAYETRISSGGITPFARCADPRAAQVRLTAASADLLALANDEISPAKAWATGRLKIEASFTDLLRLRKLL
ncbi:SCP2 sterol-binding domain-containing protein [Actinocorallia longicatena]|uniref:SCP2 domain-containing protein n=1 Tax=Actinocorallia longicatena TaxID=111803 RepID=A0ABP6QUH0_9ACTN